MVSNAGSSLAGEPEMSCNTSKVAASRSSASVSSRVSRSTFVSLSAAGKLRRPAAPRRATVLWRCVLTALWPVLLRRLIVTPRPGDVMVAIWGSAHKGVIAGGTEVRVPARQGYVLRLQLPRLLDCRDRLEHSLELLSP